MHDSALILPSWAPWLFPPLGGVRGRGHCEADVETEVWWLCTPFDLFSGVNKTSLFISQQKCNVVQGEVLCRPNLMLSHAMGVRGERLLMCARVIPNANSGTRRRKDCNHTATYTWLEGGGHWGENWFRSPTLFAGLFDPQNAHVNVIVYAIYVHT